MMDSETIQLLNELAQHYTRVNGTRQEPMLRARCIDVEDAEGIPTGEVRFEYVCELGFVEKTADNPCDAVRAVKQDFDDFNESQRKAAGDP